MPLRLAGIAATSAVMVVPMFSPKTIAAARSRVIQPFAAIVIVIAIATADDCTTRVRITPNAKKSRTERKPMLEYSRIHSNTSECD